MTTTIDQNDKKRDFLWPVVPKGQRCDTFTFRAIGWFSLLKVLTIGFAFGSLPFVVLLSWPAYTEPEVLPEYLVTAVTFPAVLWTWPVYAFVGAWITNFFVAVGIRLFGLVWPLRMKVLIDE